MAKIKELEQLIKSDQQRALAFLEEHREDIFKKLNCLKYGERLLTIFKGLQQFFTHHTVDYKSYKKAVDFYHKHRGYLHKIDIKSNPDSFVIFQTIAEENDKFEREYHKALIKYIEDKLKTSMSEAALNQLMKDIDGAYHLLDVSVTKLKKDPKPTYTQLKEFIIQKLRNVKALENATTPSQSSSNQSLPIAPRTGVHHSPLSSAQDLLTQQVLAPNLLLAEKDTSKQTAPIASDSVLPVSLPLCHISSALTFFKNPDEATTTRKRRAIESSDDNEPFKQPEIPNLLEAPKATRAKTHYSNRPIPALSVESVIGILIRAIPTYRKTESADVIRELARFCRKVASKDRRLIELLQRASRLYSIARAWGNTLAGTELEYLNKEYPKVNFKKHSIEGHSSGTVMKLIHDTCQEIRVYVTDDISDNIFNDLFNQLLNESRFAPDHKTSLIETIRNNIESYIEGLSSYSSRPK